jgi:hypothetical protein
VKGKSTQTTWGGARKRAGRKPLGEQKRVHRSITIDPDIYQCLILDSENLQAQGTKVKISDVLNCRLRRDYKREPGQLIPDDLARSKREKQKTFKKPTSRITR